MTEKISMSFDEIETTINYSKYHIGEWAEVYTTDKQIMRRYEKFIEKHPEYCKLLKEDKYSMTFSIHPNCASLKPRAPRKVIHTEEQKQALRERMTEVRKLKNA